MSGRAAGVPAAVLGAGSWGTALAIQFARGGRPVRLWGRNPKPIPASQPPLPLAVETSLDAALRGAQDVLIAVPSHALRSILTEIAPRLTSDMRVAWATKG